MKGKLGLLLKNNHPVFITVVISEKPVLHSFERLCLNPHGII
jgi:hypothetical protein